MSELVLKSSLSDAAGNDNEDAIGSRGAAAWVIDGATGLASRKLTAAATDAQWYARTLDEQLFDSLHSSTPLRDVVCNAVQHVANALKLVCPADTQSYEFPSAAAAVVRLDGGSLHYFVLGDCAIMFIRDGEVQVIRDTRLVTFEEPLLATRSRAVRESGQLSDGVRSELRERFRALRSSMNTPAGYWILSTDCSAVDQALVGQVQVANGSHVMLASDGLLRLVDVFHSMSYARLFERAVNEGLENLVRTLRQYERDDPVGIAFPRMKALDDASAIVVGIANRANPR